jgi:tetratricopeptide (TPR) repeat protein
LRDVIRELAREYPLNPIAWGGFVLYGDDGVLTRHHPVRSLNLASRVLDSRKPPQKSPAQQVEDRIAEGRRLMRGGDAAGALEALNSALQIRRVPDVLRARVLYERAEVLRLSGEVKQALEAYDALDEMRNLPERLRVEIELNRGTAFQMDGKPEEAIESYSVGLAFARLDLSWRASVMVNRGIAHWQLHHKDEAIADLNTVIETPGMPREQRVKAILTKAEIYFSLQQYENAESEVNKTNSLDLTPDETAAGMLVLGQVWAAQNRIEDAIATFKNVLRMDNVNERYREMASSLLTEFTAK